MLRHLRNAGRAALLAAAALSLGACLARPAAPTTPIGPTQAPVVATPPLAAPTMAPPTALPAASAQATATPLPPTATPPPATATALPTPGLVGPEWTVLAGSGDFDGNTVFDILAYKPSPVIISAPGGDQVSVQASELVLVERGADGRPRVRLLIDRDGIRADGRPLASFGAGDSRPVGFWARGGGAVGALTLTLLNASGQQYTQDILIAYSVSAGAYRVFGPGGEWPVLDGSPQPQPPTPAPPTPAPPAGGPLLGEIWTVLASGDTNGDGVEDAIAYAPADLISRSGRALEPRYDSYVLASQAVIVARGADGRPVTQVHAVADVVMIDGQPVYAFPGGPHGHGPAAFLVSALADGAALVVVPLGPDGDLLGPAALVSYDPAGRYFAAEQGYE